MSEFYKKASKLLKLENSKEVLHEAQEASTSKKNDQRKRAENKKGSEKRRNREKAQRNREVDWQKTKHHF